MALSIEPTDATLGAIVTGIELSALDDATWREIETAFHEHALLIFPGQSLAPHTQVIFATRFGEIEQLYAGYDSVALSNKDQKGGMAEEGSYQMEILRGNEGWHTDSSYMPLAAKASLLSARVVPSKGGETEWADARAAYDGLGETAQFHVADLMAHHSYFHSQAKIGHQVEVGAGYGFYEGAPPLRPLIKVHPVTGRKALYIGRHAYGIPGLAEEESERLLHDLLTFTCQPPRTYTHAWQAGDVAVWDNRSVLHRARPFDHREAREMLHTRIKGDPTTESEHAPLSSDLRTRG
ncbi:MAG: TauD/TfdA family dioxygenase [Pirellulaceae bacterium]|nr:TauD/TfdA family dioxygenase [Pirellulaceae bacterium]